MEMAFVFDAPIDTPAFTTTPEVQQAFLDVCKYYDYESAIGEEKETGIQTRLPCDAATAQACRTSFERFLTDVVPTLCTRTDAKAFRRRRLDEPAVHYAERIRDGLLAQFWFCRSADKSHARKACRASFEHFLTGVVPTLCTRTDAKAFRRRRLDEPAVHYAERIRDGLLAQFWFCRSADKSHARKACRASFEHFLTGVVPTLCTRTDAKAFRRRRLDEPAVHYAERIRDGLLAQFWFCRSADKSHARKACRASFEHFLTGVVPTLCTRTDAKAFRRRRLDEPAVHYAERIRDGLLAQFWFCRSADKSHARKACRASFEHFLTGVVPTLCTRTDAKAFRRRRLDEPAVHYAERVRDGLLAQFWFCRSADKSHARKVLEALREDVPSLEYIFRRRLKETMGRHIGQYFPRHFAEYHGCVMDRIGWAMLEPTVTEEVETASSEPETVVSQPWKGAGDTIEETSSTSPCFKSVALADVQNRQGLKLAGIANNSRQQEYPSTSSIVTDARPQSQMTPAKRAPLHEWRDGGGGRGDLPGVRVDYLQRRNEERKRMMMREREAAFALARPVTAAAAQDKDIAPVQMRPNRLPPNLYRENAKTAVEVYTMKRAFLEGKDPKSIPKEEWKKQLTEEEYRVTRQAQTEAPFTGKFEKHFKQGKYVCNCCGAELFVSETKYDAECGWPSFFASSKAAGKKADANISRRPDNSIPNRPRTEVRCNKCDAHLGHVFQEEPTPTGERYCINSVAIDFESDVGTTDGSTTEEVTECDGKDKGQVTQPTNEQLKDEKITAKSTETKQENKKKAEDEKKDKS